MKEKSNWEVLLLEHKVLGIIDLDPVNETVSIKLQTGSECEHIDLESANSFLKEQIEDIKKSHLTFNPPTT